MCCMYTDSPDRPTDANAKSPETQKGIRLLRKSIKQKDYVHSKHFVFANVASHEMEAKIHRMIKCKHLA